jgi:hypothetical protein
MNPLLGGVITSILLLLAVYGSLELFHLQDLEYLMDEMPISKKSGHYRVSTTQLIFIELGKFLRGMALADDYYFIKFWYSYGESQFFRSRANGYNFSREVSYHGKEIFGTMNDNFRSFLANLFFPGLLDLAQQKDKEELLSMAKSLYNGRFYSIWMRLLKPNAGKFDSMRDVFIFLQATIDHSIYEMLEVEFYEMYRDLEKADKQSYFKHEQRFELLVDSLSHDQENKFGLLWIADHPDPILVLCYFLYRKSKPIQTPKSLSLHDLSKAIENFKDLVDDDFLIVEGRVGFLLEFQSPYDNIGDYDLKVIISKIITKFYEAIGKSVSSS